MGRIQRGKLTEDVAANNVGDGNLAIPIPPIKAKKGKKKQKKEEVVSFRRILENE